MHHRPPVALKRLIEPVLDPAIPLLGPSGDIGVDYHDLCGDLFRHTRDDLGRVPAHHLQTTARMPQGALQPRHSRHVRPAAVRPGGGKERRFDNHQGGGSVMGGCGRPCRIVM